MSAARCGAQGVVFAFVRTNRAPGTGNRATVQHFRKGIRGRVQGLAGQGFTDSWLGGYGDAAGRARRFGARIGARGATGETCVTTRTQRSQMSQCRMSKE